MVAIIIWYFSQLIENIRLKILVYLPVEIEFTKRNLEMYSHEKYFFINTVVLKVKKALYYFEY